ncbi:hypothetical protein [Phenylobacterium sp.]|uniref:hypothetical protein n=1 Tax=Phenylobacterium sp. TaxID=1871053 RepID=UPI002E38103F|nr:hypothetical protein [Phenylobacterium sp.]HEX2560220.1 hypothetical protein [Phenylobacterium sp.]
MKSALFLALALFLADEAPAQSVGGAGAEPTAAESKYPPGAPRDDYGLVAWCYGALGGYLELHDDVMPEVTRIESTFRAPGRTLEEDLKVYSDMQRDGRRQMKLFAAAMEAAEKASLRPLNAVGAEAVKKGRGVWAAAPNLPKARVAQEWMSWALPARCESTAVALENRAKLMGAGFRAGGEEEAAPAEAEPATDAAPVETPPEAVASEAPAEPAAVEPTEEPPAA